MQEALEVRPRMRLISAPLEPELTPPVITGSEQRPVIRDADAPVVDLEPKPTPRIIVELRPVIRDIEED
jgi:hypothetical protein